MKTLIAILIILSLLQATIIPLDLVLMVLILRSYIVNEKSNLILAFIFGLFISHLTFTPFGVLSLLFLVFVQASQMLSKSPLSSNPLVILPVMALFLSLNEIIFSSLMHQSVNLWPKVVVESVISLPIFIIIRIWEEWFVASPDIKLKI